MYNTYGDVMDNCRNPNDTFLQKDIITKIDKVISICNIISQLDIMINTYKDKISHSIDMENEQLLIEYTNEREFQIKNLQKLIFPDKQGFLE